jgi:SHS2 domain-containing protein
MAEAFENLAYGMFSIMAELDRYEPTGSKVVYAAGLDDVVLLERFLTQLLVLFDSEGVLPVDFEITEISLGRLTCWVSVRKIGPDIEWLGPTVKAVTYHQIAVENVGEEWTARAIFDV